MPRLSEKVGVVGEELTLYTTIHSSWVVSVLVHQILQKSVDRLFSCGATQLFTYSNKYVLTI